MSARSNSRLGSVPLGERLRDWTDLMALYLKDIREPPDFSGLQRWASVYAEVLKRYSGKALSASRVVEIGYGARPRQLYWLAAAHGVDVVGIDLDRPVMRGTPTEFLRIARTNGWERAFKSAARFLLVDTPYWRAFGAAATAESGRPFRKPFERLRVGNASSAEFWREHRAVDLIYSDNVFEHIPPDDLQRLISEMAESLSPEGVACITPMIYTGISGGHHLEWGPHTIVQGHTRTRRTEPWEHLRRNQHPANTYLNRLSRRNFRLLFQQYFEIAEERVKHPNLGIEFMTPDIRSELSAYDDDELFSNEVLFILTPRKH